VLILTADGSIDGSITAEGSVTQTIGLQTAEVTMSQKSFGDPLVVFTSPIPTVNFEWSVAASAEVNLVAYLGVEITASAASLPIKIFPNLNVYISASLEASAESDGTCIEGSLKTGLGASVGI